MEDDIYDLGYLTGVTVTPNGNRLTNYRDWSNVNLQEREAKDKKKEQELINRFTSNIRLATGRIAPYVATGLSLAGGAGLLSNAINPGTSKALQYVDMLFRPSTWYNPVTGGKLLSTNYGLLADAGVQAGIAAEGALGLQNLYDNGTLSLSNPATYLNGLALTPVVAPVVLGIANTSRTAYLKAIELKNLLDMSRGKATPTEAPYITYGNRMQTNIPTVTFNYKGPTYSWRDIVNADGAINLKKLREVESEIHKQLGGISSTHRLENSKWHPTDWNTFLHSKDAAIRALYADYTPEEIFAAVAHDAGKMFAGEGHGPIGANILKLVFPDLTHELLVAIAEHMDKYPATPMGRSIKGVDIAEANPFRQSSLKSPIINNLTSHLQGDDAVKMFKEYGGIEIPEGSINGELLRKYVMEARERYGLVGNTDITDEEIAQALYKHVLELGKGSGAVNALGEPLLLFRGDTKSYTELRPRLTPEELVTRGGTMDNSLGTLFLGELPKGGSDQGVAKYLNTAVSAKGMSGTPPLVVYRPSLTGGSLNFDGKVWDNIYNYPSSIEHNTVEPVIVPEDASFLYTGKNGLYSVYKLPSRMATSGVNEINGFVVRTPKVRDMSLEMQVLEPTLPIEYADEFHWLTANKPKFVPDESGFPLVEYGDYPLEGILSGNETGLGRLLYADLYSQILKRSLLNNLGLLYSKPRTVLRREHNDYGYFALPNWNLQNAKHILPYDLRIPRNWNSRNIYKSLIGAGLLSNADGLLLNDNL